MASSLNGKRILIVGGAGFIGHNMALQLKADGAEVTVIDSLQVNNLLSFQSTDEVIANRGMYLKIIRERLALLNDNEIPVIVQDARDYHAISRIFVQFKPDAVVHLAAVAHANRSNKDPYSTFDHSLRTLENSLDAARDNSPHFIYFSSSMVYGNFKGGVVSEDSVCEPIGIYGALKFAGEKMVIAYNQVFDLPYTIIRPSALYGERCVSRRVGQIFIENALAGAPVMVQGDGTDSLDFTYIDDLVHGIKQVLTEDKSRNEIFNLTYGEGRSLYDMVGILREYFPDVDIQYKDRDKLMPQRGTLRVDKAHELIGYTPSWPLEKGFRKYIEWYHSSFKDGPKTK